MTSIDWQAMMANSTKVGEPIPDGTYQVVSESATFGSSRNGDPQWKVVWRIIGGPQNGRKVFDQFTLSQGSDDKAALTRGFFFRDLKSLGIDEAFFAQMPANEVIAQRLGNLNAVISVVKNGQYSNVDGYTLSGPAGGAVPEMAAQPGFQPPAQPQFQQPQPQQPAFQPQPQYQQPAAPQPYPQQPQPQPQFGQQPMAPAFQPPVQPQAAPGQQFQPQAAPAQPPAPQAPYDPNGQQPPADPNQQFTPQPRPPF